MLGNEAAAHEYVALSNFVARTSTTNGSWIDLSKFQGDVLIYLISGTVTGTNPTCDGKLQDADDNSGTNSADIAGATFSQIATGFEVRKLVLRAGSFRRWVRLVQTIGGTTPSMILGAFALSRRPMV